MTSRRTFLKSLAAAGLAAVARVYSNPEPVLPPVRRWEPKTALPEVRWRRYNEGYPASRLTATELEMRRDGRLLDLDYVRELEMRRDGRLLDLDYVREQIDRDVIHQMELALERLPLHGAHRAVISPLPRL